MPRRAQAGKREAVPDPKYHNITVSKLINKIMTCGKKRTAESIVYGALDILEERSSKDPVTALEQAVKNATPLLEVKPRRVGGATYQVPVEVRPDRGLFLALSWLLKSARARKGKSITHRMAEANRAFAHYRW